jgi:rRNA-processing protein FCF1
MLHFGYHEPAYLLLDGNFIKLCMDKKLNIRYVKSFITMVYSCSLSILGSNVYLKQLNV